MKRFLALFAVVAIIGSMFAGVALADDPDYSFTLDRNELLIGNGEQDIVGTIYDGEDADEGLDGTNVLLVDSDGDVVDIEAIDGSDVTFTIDTDVDATAEYTFVVDADDDEEVDNDELSADFELFEYELDLSKDEVTKGTDMVKVTGRILRDGSYNKGLDDATVYVVYDEGDEGDERAVATVDGYKFDAWVDPHYVGVYYVVIDDAVDEDGVDDNDPYTEVKVVYEVNLDDELQFDYPVEDFVIVEGNILDADEVEVVLCYNFGTADEPDLENIATATTNSDGDFVMAFNGEFELTEAGDLELYVKAEDDDGTHGFEEYVLHVEGDVNAEALTVELSQNEFPVGLADEAIKITLDDVDSAYEDDNILDGYYYNVIVENDNEDEIASLNASDLTDIKDFELWDTDTLNDQDDEDNFIIAKDTYTVTVKLYSDDDELVMKGSTEFEVVSDTGYVLTGWHNFEEITVGDTEIELGEDITLHKDGATNFYYALTYEGAGISEKTKHNLDAGDVNLPSDLDEEDCVDDDTVTLSPEHAGTIAVTIDVYEVDDDDYNLVKTYEKEIVVTGYSVEVNLEEVLVDEEYELTIVVTDEDGNPVNNAYIYLVDPEDNLTLFVDPADENIIAGTYLDDEWEWANVEELGVIVYNMDKESDDEDLEVMAEVDGVIDVVGEATFNVEADIDTLLMGNEEVVTLTIIDENDDPYFPVLADVNIVDSDEGEVIELGDKVDLDDDDVKESIEVTIQVFDDDQDSIVLRVTDNDGEDQGEFEFAVVKPEVQLTSSAVLTENFESEVSFTIVDPRDNSVIEDPEAVTFTIENEDCDNEGDFAVIWYDDDEDEIDGFDGDVDVAEEYTYFVEASGIDFSAAEDEEVTPQLVISVEIIDGGSVIEVAEIPFGEATLASTPEAIIMGTNNILTLTYTDANGTVLEGYDIELDDEEIGETDENGQVIYSTASVSTTGITFEADTDGDAVVECKVKSTLDMEAPVITAPAEVNVPEVVVTVTDNVRVSAVRINGQFLTIFPLATVSEKVALVEGANTITVEAMDSNSNAAVQVLTVTYALPVAPTPDVELTVGEATEFGTPELVNGTTMVPVRFATKLGASMEWDNATKTVTYKLGDKEISMTVGSKTAKVGEDSVTLTEAPFINAQNFTMVPLRMIAQELGFQVVWTSNDAPIGIQK